MSCKNVINIIAGQLKRCPSFEDVESIFGVMIKKNIHQDCFLINQFISTCSRFRRIDVTALAFSQMEHPNAYVYNAMIRGYALCSAEISALELYLEMLRAAVSPTSFTVSSLIKSCTISSAPGFGEGIHCHIWKNGYVSDLFVQTSLIDFYSSFYKIYDSQKVFAEMSEKDAFAWTTMISGLVRVGDMLLARELFDEMPEKSIASWNTMIAGYAKVGDAVSASSLFSQMPMRDSITWTTMITCYLQNKQFREAIEIFEDMKTARIGVDAVTMATVISAYAHLGAFELGRDAHFYMMHNGFVVDVYIGSALVDMYAKCGSIERSLVIFLKLQEKNLFCWNCIIEGLAMHGYGEQALAMFKKMEAEKVEPNDVTFVSLLSACTHVGMVSEGRRIFLSMINDYSIFPGVEHYGCMVDLLGRAGLLEEALELIKGMKIEPNSVIWGALLGGCKLHKNLRIAEVALKKLMDLEPGNSGYYALLVNIYAEENHWVEVASVRATMKERGVQKKCPGTSWIEIDGEVHEFVASDKYHPMSSEICSLLGELDGQLKLASNVAELGLI